MRRHRIWLPLLASVAAPLSAQAARQPRHKIDPYTRNQPEALAALGYVSYGPAEFGTRGSKVVTTDDIEKDLAYAELRWIETAHFVIGSTLRTWSVPLEPDIRAKIRGELDRLNERGIRVSAKKRELDPWLRLHLIAMRAESTYAEIQDWLKVTDADFPASPDTVVSGQSRYMGYGPHLGQKGKYLLLLCDDAGTYQDYLKRYVGRDSRLGQRWHFKDTGSLFYGVSAESDEGRLKDDTALHCNIVFNVVHNCLDGYRHYSYDLPVWIKEGLAHWFERRVNPRWNSFDQNEGSLADMKPLWRWEPKTRQLLAAGKGTPLAEAYTWRDYGQIGFDDHVLLWSRWDFLLSQGKDKFAGFMMRVKGRIDPVTWRPDPNDIVGATRDALLEAYGLTPLTLDEKWKEWVLANYPAQ